MTDPKLPELPAEVGYRIAWADRSYRGGCSVSFNKCHPEDGASEPLYTAAQMHAYARAHIATRLAESGGWEDDFVMLCHDGQPCKKLYGPTEYPTPKAVTPSPNWCRTCGKHWSDPMAVFCSDGIHNPNKAAPPAAAVAKGANWRCPRCGGKEVERERRPNGNARCENGHGYPMSQTVKDPPTPSAGVSEAMVLAIVHAWFGQPTHTTDSVRMRAALDAAEGVK